MVWEFFESKLKNQGIEFISEPDVPQAAGLNLLEDIKDWLRLLSKTKLLTPAEIALMVRKTAENAFYRNTQELSGLELGEKPLTVTVRAFLEVRSHFTPSMVREEDKIVEICNKAVYARPAVSPDTSRWAKNQRFCLRIERF